MKPSELLRTIGKPIAYYHELSKPLGGVTASILFGQLFYWHDKTDNPLGVYKTQEELRDETGLSRTELETARKKLKAIGILIETEKRLEHRIYFKLDLAAFDALLLGIRETANPASTNAKTVQPPVQESCIRETANPASVIDQENTYTRLHTNITPLPPEGKSASADGVQGNLENKKNQDDPPKLNKPKKTKSDPIDYQGVLNAYNGLVEQTQRPLARAEVLNPRRKRLIKTLAGILKTNFDDSSVETFRNYFEDFLRHAGDFYFGNNDRGWKADFEYLLREGTFTKTFEGSL